MKITSVIDPQWANENKTLINCQITIEKLGDQVVAFTASMNDVEIHGRRLFADLIDGVYGSIADYIPPPLPSEELLADQARQKRDQLLVELDAIVSNPLRWNSLSQTQHAAYATYRQDLLDVPQQPGFPTTIVWPTKP